MVNTCVPRSALVLGYSAASSLMIRSMSACAISSVTPSDSLAITGNEWFPRGPSRTSGKNGR
jgi:hypothetical protein